MIKENWNFYTNWLKTKLPKYAALLNSGASVADIEKLESYLQFSVPDDLKILLQTNNGDSKLKSENTYLGAFLGFEFLSVDRIISIHEDWKNYVMNEYDGTSFPATQIKIAYTNPKWIPLFADGAGNYVGIDLDPDLNGVSGQIINFGRDEENKFVIAKNLNSFMEFVVGKINSGECDAAITEEEEGDFSYGLNAQSHLIDDLREIYGE